MSVCKKIFVYIISQIFFYAMACEEDNSSLQLHKNIFVSKESAENGKIEEIYISIKKDNDTNFFYIDGYKNDMEQSYCNSLSDSETKIRYSVSLEHCSKKNKEIGEEAFSAIKMAIEADKALRSLENIPDEDLVSTMMDLYEKRKCISNISCFCCTYVNLFFSKFSKRISLFLLMPHEHNIENVRTYTDVIKKNTGKEFSSSIEAFLKKEYKKDIYDTCNKYIFNDMVENKKFEKYLCAKHESKDLHDFEESYVDRLKSLVFNESQVESTSKLCKVTVIRKRVLEQARDPVKELMHSAILKVSGELDLSNSCTTR